MRGIPSDDGDAIDNSLCDYEGYFPDIMCVLCTCQKCGTEKYKKYLEGVNAAKFDHKTKRFLIKQWFTKNCYKRGKYSVLPFLEICEMQL